MFSHVMVGVSDLEKSKRFYDAVLGAIGIAPGMANGNRYFYRSPTGTFGITTPINLNPAVTPPPSSPQAVLAARSSGQCDHRYTATDKPRDPPA